MERWTPNKLILESKFPEGSEDVHFKKTQEGAVIVKAHAFVLAQVSEVFAQQIYPLSEGQSLPILFTTWTRVTSDEKALEAFVLILPLLTWRFCLESVVWPSTTSFLDCTVTSFD